MAHHHKKHTSVTHLYLILAIVVVGLACQKNIAILVQARAFPSSSPLLSHLQPRYSKFLGTLGLVCKCCDGTGKDCTTLWEGSCANLHCSNWKLH